MRESGSVPVRTPFSIEAIQPRWRWLIPVLAAVAAFHFSGIGLTLDRAFFDATSRRPWSAPPLDPAASALVLIDDHTMAEAQRSDYGWRWPFPRLAFAGLIAALDRAGAERIVLDLTFLESSAAAEQDALLAAVAAAVPGTILGRTKTQGPVFWDEAFVAAHPEFFARPRTGHTQLMPDSDGVARRYDLPGSLAASASDAPAVSATEPVTLRWFGGLEKIQAAGVPVVSAARFFNPGLHLVDRLAEKTFSVEAMEPDVGALQAALAEEPLLTGAEFDAVRGRTVFVGANAAGTYDLKALPVGQLEPGVLLHWTAWNNLRGGGFINEWPRLASLVWAAVLVGVLAVIGLQRGGLLLAFVTALLLAVATLAVAYIGLSHGWFIAPATPVAGTLLALSGVIAEGLWVEQRRRREVQTMFGSYVDPTVVERLVRDPGAITLGGERRVATVLFCDLAGFTDLSEQVSPEELLGLINAYLEETSDALLAHGAYIDKYIGDAIMAVFGAPQPDPRHAESAARAALAAQEVLARLNDRLRPQYGRTLAMRIGINTGELVVGNVGSPRKRNYTVLGDTVNLASRLEGANKEFGTSILIGETTAREIGDRLLLRPLTRLRVKGKQQAVEVSEVLGESSTVLPVQQEFLAAYRPAYAAFANRQFSQAADGFSAALALAPDDLMTKALLAEARRFSHSPPPIDWEPIVTLSSK